MSFPFVRCLSWEQLTRIWKLRDKFLRAEALTGVPWEAIAAIWYRESFSVAAPKRPGGPFQFDPPNPSDKKLRDYLKRYTRMPEGSPLFEQHIKHGINEFESATVFAACHLRNNCRATITPNATDAEIKDAFYGYNGRAYNNVERSPYVMNGFDEARGSMPLRGTVRNADGENVWVSIVDKRPGAFVVYRQLKMIADRPPV